MPISGNVNSMTVNELKRARVEGDYRVNTGSLAADGKTWPIGLLLVKASAATKWAPLTALPTSGVWFLGVLDEEVDTSTADIAQIVRFGGVRLAELKVGVDAPVAPSAEYVHALEANKIYAV